MARGLLNRYIWLVDTIYRSEKITLENINQKWLMNDMSGGNPYPPKTFHNHRDAIEELFDINIICNLSTYEYYIENVGEMDRGGMRQWLINTFAVNNLINESHKLKQRIQFENIPSGQQYLTTIIEAMRDGLKLNMCYQSYRRSKADEFEMQPYFLKVFKQRWYVIAKSDAVRIHALDRIQSLTPTACKFKMPKDFDPEAYFNDCYGIIHDEMIKPQEVKLKITANQSKYLRALPLHHSQQETETTEDYSIFRFYIKPTFDFRQELLSLGEDMEVLSPDTLRVDVLKAAEKMSKIHEKK